MKTELTRKELEMVNGGLTLWDIIFDAGERAFTWLDEEVVEPVTKHLSHPACRGSG